MSARPLAAPDDRRLQRLRPFGVGLRAAALLGTCALFAPSCTAAAGAGAAGVAVAAGALASACYGYVDVTVIDATTGGSTCEAEVIARDEDGSETSLRSCFHAALGEGKWQLTASKQGFLPAESEVVIESRSDCARIVYSLVMTLDPVGAGTRAPRRFRPETKAKVVHAAPSAVPEAPPVADTTSPETPGSAPGSSPATPSEPTPRAPTTEAGPSAPGVVGPSPAPTKEPVEPKPAPTDEKPKNPYVVP